MKARSDDTDASKNEGEKDSKVAWTDVPLPEEHRPSKYPFETFITILKIQIHTFDKQKQFYQKMGSNELMELLGQPFGVGYRTVFCRRNRRVPSNAALMVYQRHDYLRFSDHAIIRKLQFLVRMKEHLINTNLVLFVFFYFLNYMYGPSNSKLCLSHPV